MCEQGCGCDRCRNSKTLHGLEVSDSGTSVSATDCDFQNNQQDNILVQTGAQVSLEGCLCDGAKTLHGVEARDSGTQVRMVESDSACQVVCETQD